MDYTYDDLANLTGVYRKVSPADPNNRTDPNVIATTFTYDTTHIYDINSITDPMGNTTYFQYDPNGNVIQTTYPAVAVHGYAQPQTPIVGYTYNSHGQVDTMTAPDGIVTKYLYYSDANPSDPNCGKLWKTIADYNSVDGLNLTTEYAYDAYGNIREITRPQRRCGQVHLQRAQPADADRLAAGARDAVHLQPQQEGHEDRAGDRRAQPGQSFTYDILDHVKTSTDPAWLRDPLRLHERAKSPTSSPMPRTIAPTSVYNERGLLIQVSTPTMILPPMRTPPTATRTTSQDAKSNKTHYEYDKFGRLIRITYPDDSFEAFTYDKNSNVLSRTQRNGDTIRYEYDALKRLRVKSRPGEPNLVYTYDIAGRIYDVNDGGRNHRVLLRPHRPRGGCQRPRGPARQLRVRQPGSAHEADLSRQQLSSPTNTTPRASSAGSRMTAMTSWPSTATTTWAAGPC